MLTDAQLRPSNAQSLVGAAATTVSTNTIDLLTAGRNIGRGQPMRAIVQVVAAFTGGTALRVDYIQSANADLSSPDILASSATIVDANLTAGATVMDIPLPNNTKRYIGFQYVTTGTHSTGTVSAHLVSDTDFNNYPVSVTGY